MIRATSRAAGGVGDRAPTGNDGLRVRRTTWTFLGTDAAADSSLGFAWDANTT